MKRNNTKLLTEEQKRFINDKYMFKFEEDKIVVISGIRCRHTYHDSNKPFILNVKGIRVIHFTMDAIQIWKDLYKDYPFTLIDVQQAANKLILTYQKVTKEAVLKILKGNDVKIKNI